MGWSHTGGTLGFRGSTENKGLPALAGGPGQQSSCLCQMTGLARRENRWQMGHSTGRHSLAGAQIAEMAPCGRGRGAGERLEDKIKVEGREKKKGREESWSLVLFSLIINSGRLCHSSTVNADPPLHRATQAPQITFHLTGAHCREGEHSGFV